MYGRDCLRCLTSVREEHLRLADAVIDEAVQFLGVLKWRDA
jgi:hypothetical protein